MPTAEELLKAFESLPDKGLPRGNVPGGTPTANALARRFLEMEAGAAAEAAPAAAQNAAPLTQRSGLLTRAIQGLRSWRAPAAASEAVQATKAAASAQTAAKAGALAKAAKWLTTLEKGFKVRPIKTLAAAEAGRALLGLGLTVGAQNTLNDAHEDAVRLLGKYGMEVERGNEETGANMGIGDAYAWFTGGDLYTSPIETVKRAWAGEGDPNWTDPRSDVDQLRVYDPSGREITAKMTTDTAFAQMKRQSDLFRAAGLMDNKVRKERGLPPVYSPADLLGKK